MLTYVTVKEGSPKGPVVMLLHGVGSNEANMAPLAAGMDERLRVISVRAPLVMGPSAFGWFPVQFTSMGPMLDPVGAEQARQQVVEFVRAYREQSGIDKVYLVGFSQGAILAVVTALSEPELIAGAAGLSGRLPTEFDEVIATPERIQATRFWIGHGVADEKLPVQLARALSKRLGRLGARYEYNEFPAPHTVTPEMLRGVEAWLKQDLDA